MKLSEAKQILKNAGVEDYSHDARELFIEIGGIPRRDLIGSDPDCSSEELSAAIERRAAREPLQYILGYTYFYKERYTVGRDCLIPRPDTEVLVDYAVQHIAPGSSVLDLCTGSGCVAISTLVNTVRTKAHLVDISEGALAVARENARDNGVAHRVSFERCDLTKNFPAGRWDAILSNPPYVSSSAYRELEREISHEPREAFVGGEDGADFYRILIPQCKEHIHSHGFIAFEIGYDQAQILSALAEENGLSSEIIYDLGGNPRVAVLKVKQ